MEILLVLLTILVIVATLTPLMRNTHWIVRGWDFPRLQIATVAGLLIIPLMYLAQWSDSDYWFLVAALGACLIYQLWWILPYTKLWKPEVQGTDDENKEVHLSLITANVLMTNQEPERLIKLVQKYKPDMLVTLETNKWWEEKLEVLEKELPHTVKCPLENLYGMHLYSRFPLQDTELSFLVEEDVPSIHTCIELDCKASVRMHFLHPAPPSPTENEKSKERDAELVIVAKNVSKSSQPLVVTGDLNDVAWSKTTRLFRKISGLLDPRVGRGMYNTFHADYSLLRWPLDHIFISDHFRLCHIKRLPSIGSDHFPLYTELCYQGGHVKEEEGLKKDMEDEQLSDEMAREEGVSEKDVPEPGE
jgi:endonuclease/exonuclease/phosphatase (EEP) superfamily protein YafD